MLLLKQAINGAGWLSIFKLISQLISWSTTILITRLLSSQDYGLMEMATVFTGYLSFFVEFGITAALVNRETVTHEELSSSFWAMLMWGLFLATGCLILAPLTVIYFEEPRLLHLTQAAGVLFVLSSLIIVPRSILHRELRFKEIGAIEIITIIVSSVTMIGLAYFEAGAWTLIGGFIARELSTNCMMLIRSGFIPSFTFSFRLIAPLLHFGTPVVLSSSLFYIYTKADRFFGGRTFGAEDLGYYALALQLAAIPVEKIVSLLQSVLYPTLSKLKSKPSAFNEVYLSFVSILSIITFPLFIGGLLVSPELVIVLLGEKWRNAIEPLQILLISQLIMAVSAPNSLIHSARGKPGWNLLFNLVITPAMVFAFYMYSQEEFIYQLAIPWITVYPLFQLAYILITNRELGIPFSIYLKQLHHPTAACLLMTLSIYSISYLWTIERESALFLATSISIGALTYLTYFLLFGRNLLTSLRDLRNKDF